MKTPRVCRAIGFPLFLVAVSCGGSSTSAQSTGGAGGSGHSSDASTVGVGAVCASGGGGGEQADGMCENVSPPIQHGLIDDFEDGDMNIIEVDGRRGTWGYAGDKGCLVTAPAPALPTGAGNASDYAMHVAVDSCNEWGFNMSSALNPLSGGYCPCSGYDASAWDGVYYWAKSDSQNNKIGFNIYTTGTVPAELGGDGRCEAGLGCSNAHGVKDTLSGEWALYWHTWNELKQGAGWGTPVDFDPGALISLVWSVSIADMPADFWIDRIGFFKGIPSDAP